MGMIIVCGTILIIAFMILLSIPQSSLRSFLLQLATRRCQEESDNGHVGAGRGFNVKG